METKNKYGVVETILDVITAIGIVVGLVENVYIFIWAILTLVFGCVCKKIGQSKGIDYGFLVGWLLGILGLIIMLVLPGNEQNTQNISKYEELEQLQKLKENGTITEAEFEVEKSKLLK